MGTVTMIPATKRVGNVLRKEAQPKKPKVVIQSPFGGEITPEEIFAKIDNAETVYVRVDVNKAYWVNGEEYGNVDLW